MQKRIPGLAALFADRKAVTALEYGIVAAGLAFIFIVAFGTIGTSLALRMASVTAGI